MAASTFHGVPRRPGRGPHHLAGARLGAGGRRHRGGGGARPSGAWRRPCSRGACGPPAGTTTPGSPLPTSRDSPGGRRPGAHGRHRGRPRLVPLARRRRDPPDLPRRQTCCGTRSRSPRSTKGFWLNIKLFVVAEILVLVWALVVALVRMFPGAARQPVRFLAIAYTDVFRGFPAIVVIYLVVFGIQLAGLPVDPEPRAAPARTAVLAGACSALTLVYGAYVAEVYRSGLESIHWSQTAAARSLGLSWPADDAPRRRAPGGAAHHPAAAERLHRAAEGHRAARASSACSRSLDRARIIASNKLQPLPHRRRRHLLPRHHHPAGPLHRLPDRSGTSERMRAGGG